MPDLTVLAGNLHNNPAAARYIAQRSRADANEPFDIGLLSETQKRRARSVLNNLPGHRVHTGPRGYGSNDAARETAILVAAGLPDLGHGYAKLSDELPQHPEVGKERWGQVAVTTVEGITVAAVCLHPVAAPTALRLGHNTELTRAHRDAVDWLDATLAYHRLLGREVVAGGDVNVRHEWKGAAPLLAVLDGHDMGAHWDGLDLIAWTPGLTAVAESVDHDFPSDHPALRVELAINRRRNRR